MTRKPWKRMCKVDIKSLVINSRVDKSTTDSDGAVHRVKSVKWKKKNIVVYVILSRVRM